MLDIYLFATIAGGLLCGVSLLSGRAPGGKSGRLSRMFALHARTYLLAFIGAGGLALRQLLHVREPFAALGAVVFGVLGSVLVRDLVRRTGLGAEADPVELLELVGVTGSVVLPCHRGAPGRVRVQAHDGPVDVAATTHDLGELRSGEEVLIVEVDVQAHAVLVTRQHHARVPAAAP